MGFSRQEYWSGLPYPLPWASPVVPGAISTLQIAHRRLPPKSRKLSFRKLKEHCLGWIIHPAAPGRQAWGWMMLGARGLMGALAPGMSSPAHGELCSTWITWGALDPARMSPATLSHLHNGCFFRFPKSSALNQALPGPLPAFIFILSPETPPSFFFYLFLYVDHLKSLC